MELTASTRKWAVRSAVFLALYALNAGFLAVSAQWERAAQEPWLVAIGISMFSALFGSVVAVLAGFYVVTTLVLRYTGRRLGFRWLFIGSFALLGLVCVLGAFGEVVTGLRSLTFPQASGLILSSSMTSDTSVHRDDRRNSRKRIETTYDFQVKYEYQAAGQTRVGTEYDVSSGSLDQGTVSSLVQAYPAGASVTVYYDPWNPSSAVLKPGLTANWVLLVLVGAVFMFLSWGTHTLFQRNGAKQIPGSDPASPS